MQVDQLAGNEAGLVVVFKEIVHGEEILPHNLCCNYWQGIEGPCLPWHYSSPANAVVFLKKLSTFYTHDTGTWMMFDAMSMF